MQFERLAPALVVAVLLTACTAGRPPESTPAVASVNGALIVDTDMDSSDVMALPYLLAQADRQILAVTVPATGVAHCPIGAVHAASLVQLMQRDIPVACGSGSNRAGIHPFPDWLRGFADDAYGLSLAAPDHPPFGDAVALLESELSETSEPVTILTLGPLTNIAQLIQQRPELSTRIGRVLMMGGAFEVPGNVEADAEIGAAEWNIWADPAAARVVMQSGIHVTMVPLDATADVPVTDEFLRQLRDAHDAVAADLAYELMLRNPVLASGGQFFWDQLTAVALDHPDVLRVLRLHVDVRLEGTDAGRTVKVARGPQVEVAVGADDRAFMSAFLSELRRGPLSPSPFGLGASFDVKWDGTACSATGSSTMTTGASSVIFADETGTARLLLLTVHDHSWSELEEFVKHFAPGMSPPDFVGLAPIEARGSLPQVVDIDQAGTIGFACLTMNGTEVAGVVLSRSFDLADAHH
jgi:pyrimidine-specific ribonucleoside hydrolase